MGERGIVARPREEKKIAHKGSWIGSGKSNRVGGLTHEWVRWSDLATEFLFSGYRLCLHTYIYIYIHTYMYVGNFFELVKVKAPQNTSIPAFKNELVKNIFCWQLTLLVALLAFLKS